MKKLIPLLLLLTGCNQEQPHQTYTDSDGVRHEVAHEGGGFGEHLAQAAVAGAVGGAAAGAGHRAADHAINKFQERRRAPRPIRTYRAAPTRRR